MTTKYFYKRKFLNLQQLILRKFLGSHISFVKFSLCSNFIDENSLLKNLGDLIVSIKPQIATKFTLTPLLSALQLKIIALCAKFFEYF